MTLFPSRAAFLAAAVGVFGFTACAPSTAGPTYTPIVQTSPEATTTELPGESIYVKYTYPRAYFDDTDALANYFDQLEFDIKDVRSDSDRVSTPVAAAPWLKLLSSDAPDGVTISLVEASIARPVRSVKVTGSSVNVNYSETLSLTYLISVSPAFKPPQTLRGLPLRPSTPGLPSIPGVPTSTTLRNLIGIPYVTLHFSAGNTTPTVRLPLKYTK